MVLGRDINGLLVMKLTRDANTHFGAKTSLITPAYDEDMGRGTTPS
jgi:allantoicase